MRLLLFVFFPEVYTKSVRTKILNLSVQVGHHELDKHTLYSSLGTHASLH